MISNSVRWARLACGVTLIFGGIPLRADDAAAAGAIIARVATLPVLEASVESGSPKFTVMRFNAPPIVVAGERFGAVRVVCPPGKPMHLAWLFSDPTNIDEYNLMSLKGTQLAAEASRFISPPTANLDLDDEAGRGRSASSLPRPWDLFELHVLGLPARLLEPGAEYILWFKFSDRRPVDLLLAATFVDAGAKIEAADLPAVFALPILGAP